MQKKTVMKKQEIKKEETKAASDEIPLEMFNVEGSSDDESSSDDEMFNIEGSSDESSDEEKELFSIESVHEVTEAMNFGAPIIEEKQEARNAAAP